MNLTQMHPIIDMQSRLKSAGKHIVDLESEFLALVVDNVGQGNFKECESSEFQELESTEKESDFYLEEEEENVASIKTAQFNKFINVGYEKTNNQVGQDVEELKVESYNFAYGFNEGQATVELIDGNLCKAIGVNLFMNNRIFPCKEDRQDKNAHNYEICYLKYDKKRKVLWSGTNGKCSEIIEWKYDKNEGSSLRCIRKLALPMNSLGVGFTFKLHDQLFCITKCSLHKQSELFGFEDETGKRTRYDISLGKVINLKAGERVFLSNQNGVHELIQSQGSFELVKISQNSQYITALEVVEPQMLIVGLMNGSVSVINASSKKVLCQEKISQGPIISVKAVGSHSFVACTHQKQLILFEFDQSFKNAKPIHKIQLSDVTKNILFHEQNVYCCLKSGKISQFILNQHQLQTKIDFIQQKLTDGKGQAIAYNRKANKYFYYAKNSSIVKLFQIGKERTITKASTVQLTYPTELIDTNATIIASIANDQLPNSKQNLEAKQKLQLFDFILQKQVFLWELPYSECTAISFNHDGDKLALGFANGKLIILNTNNYKNCKEICQNQQQKAQCFNHQTPIRNIIWSKDGRHLKTISQKNLLFYGLTKKNDDSFELVVNDNKKTPEKEALKTQIAKAEWTEMGKFNWRNAKIWATANSVEEITQIKQSSKYLFACFDNGQMRVYNNPAVQQKYGILCKWFSTPCKFIIIEQGQFLTLLICGKGKLMSVNIQLE